MGNHQRSWIWGRHAVLEAVRSERWRPVEVRASRETEKDLRGELEAWQSEAREISGDADSPVLEFESPERLRQLCGHPDHQGLIARMPEYPYLTTAEICGNLSERSAILVLDGLQDAYNFGACLRCAEVFALDAVVVGHRHQCGVTSQVVRSSAGAVHHLPLARTDDPASALQQFRDAEMNIVAATEKGEISVPDIDFRGPTAVVVGNEGTGISESLLAECTHQAAIPQRGRLGSLNAAVATGIVLYELVRQREFLPREASR